jgi:hypothetical protein
VFINAEVEEIRRDESQDSQVVLDTVCFLKREVRMMYMKQRLFAVLLVLGSIAMIYYGWYRLKHEGVYSMRMAAFSPLVGVGGVFLLFFPAMFGKPNTTKEKVIVFVVFAIGIVAGLVNWYLMDPGFFGF